MKLYVDFSREHEESVICRTATENKMHGPAAETTVGPYAYHVTVNV